MWVLLVISSILIVIVLAKLIYINVISGKCKSNKRLNGKLVIVTGASAGIGLETALDMARRGARVIMACRNVPKALEVARHISEASGNKNIEVRELNLASLRSVRAFAMNILQTETKLHVLINNAGISGTPEKAITEDGFELTMASNHLGHFLLTNMLGGLLKAAAPSRIVCVTSLGHMFVRKFDPSDLLFNNEPYSCAQSYYRSKLCNVLMARELARRLQGTGVTAYSVDPGFVGTSIFYKDTPLHVKVFGYLLMLISKNSQQGAQSSIYCAVDDVVTQHSGKFFIECKEMKSTKLGTDDALAAQLWATSAGHVCLQPSEANI